MNEITTTSERPTSLAPKTLEEALRFADILSKSELVPKDYQGRPANAFVAIQWGQEIGLQPLQAMQNIAVINGRPALWGDAQLALVMSHPAYEWHKEDETETGATVTIKRRGVPECVRVFTIEDAKRAGLAGKQGPWQTAPKRMMKLRARAFALRDLFPDVLRGLTSAEEAQDIPPEVDIGRHDHTAAPTGPRRKSEAQAAPVTEPGHAHAEQPIVQAEEPTRREPPAAATVPPAAGALSVGQAAYLRNKATQAGIALSAICERYSVVGIENLTVEQFHEVKAELLAAS